MSTPEAAPVTATVSQERAALEVESLTAGYGGEPVISDLSMRAHAGRITAVVGPNGAGKSTLLKAIVGIIRVSSGRVHLNCDDEATAATEKLVRRGLSYVP